MNNVKRGILASFIGIGTLGYKRGIDSYKYEVEYRNAKGKKTTYFYSYAFMNGAFGCCFYMLPPVFLLNYLPKEIHRFEVYWRNLDEKNQREYKVMFDPIV